MGTWADDIFGNDLAADVAGDYRDALKTGESVETAVKRVRRAFAESMRDANDKRIVWIALAAAQSEAGTISEDVRTSALKAIAWCEAPCRDPEDFPFALDAMAKLRATLGGEPPVAKPSKPVKPVRPFGIGGEVVAVSHPNEGGEAVLYVAGPSENIKSTDTARVVWLFDLAVDDVTPASIHQALEAWRNYRQQWANGLGRRIGCYDVKGALPTRRTRLLLREISMPSEFARRMNSFGELHKASDLPFVVERDVSDWKSAKWSVDPDIDPDGDL